MMLLKDKLLILQKHSNIYHEKIFIALMLSCISAASMAQQQLPMKLWYNTPATYFEESMPIGSGLGALVYGGQ